jgi:hypothetical protein
MKMSTLLRSTAIVLLTAGFLLCSCRSDEKPPTRQAAEPGRSSAEVEAETVPGPEPGAKKAEPAATATDDPLLGKWEVVEASGDHADVNRGLRYDFRPEGKVHTWAIAAAPGENRRIANRTPGEIIEDEWSWKRTGPDTIEMVHPSSPVVAFVKVTPIDGGMIMSWNNGGQVFTLARPVGGTQ